MAKPSQRMIQDIGRLHFNHIPSKPSTQNPVYSYLFSANHSSYVPSIQNPLRSYSCSVSSSGFSNSRNLASEICSKLCLREFLSKPRSSNGVFPQISSQKHRSHTLVFGSSIRNYSCGGFPSGFSNLRHPEVSSKLQAFYSRSLGFCKLNGISFGSRCISFKSSDFSKINGNFTKTVVDKPLSSVRSVFARYREAIGLQIEAFWKRNFLVVIGAVGVGICILLWRVMFRIASTFVGLSEGLAKYGFLALSSAIVAFAGLYVRSRFIINPDKVYRMAMRKLNTSAGILEVMGAPLSGTDLRAYVMSGGGLTLKKFKPRLRNKRCFLIFPVRGSERKGLVSVEVKKKKGQYDMKLLAVDVPMTTGPDQRLFLIGDEGEYKVGGGLISELRDPIVKAMTAEKEFEAIDEKEEEEDAERELEDAERKRLEEIGKLDKGSPP